MKFAKGIFICLLLLLVVGAGVIASGVISISALEGHTKPVKALLGFAMHRSVAFHADKSRMPDMAGASADRGRQIVEQSCAICHETAGVERKAFAEHMNPEPPEITHVAEKPPEQLYYVIRNGILMTGMPAFGPILSDEEIRDVIAALKSKQTTSGGTYTR